MAPVRSELILHEIEPEARIPPVVDWEYSYGKYFDPRSQVMNFSNHGVDRVFCKDLNMDIHGCERCYFSYEVYHVSSAL